MKKICFVVCFSFCAAVLFGCSAIEFKDMTMDDFIEKLNNTIGDNEKIGRLEENKLIEHMASNSYKTKSGVNIIITNDPTRDELGLITLEYELKNGDEGAEDFGEYMANILKISTNMDSEKTKRIFEKLGADHDVVLGLKKEFTSKENVQYNFNINEEIMQLTVLQR